ncbi:MAG: hypothetical protein JWM31_2148, partial [Solirubrobacterales bacterium]|nr:hypothetical protein [Solirubrobacterales bacterium]
RCGPSQRGAGAHECERLGDAGTAAAVLLPDALIVASWPRNPVASPWSRAWKYVRRRTDACGRRRTQRHGVEAPAGSTRVDPPPYGRGTVGCTCSGCRTSKRVRKGRRRALWTGLPDESCAATPRLSAKAEFELLIRFHRRGDYAARQGVIESGMSLVHSLAFRYQGRGIEQDGWFKSALSA